MPKSETSIDPRVEPRSLCRDLNAMTEERPTRRDLRLIARDLYEWPQEIEFRDEHLPTAVVRVGLHARTQRLLKSLAFLDESGLEDCADSIVRAMFDLASLFVWLSDEKEWESRFGDLLRSHQRDAKLLADTGIDVFAELYADARAIAEEFAGASPRRKLPSIEERLRGHPLEDHYYRYRDLCRHSHASYTAATMYVDREDKSEGIRFTSDGARKFASHFLAYGCLTTFVQTMELIGDELIVGPDAIGSIGEQLWRYWREVEGKDPTGRMRA